MSVNDYLTEDGRGEYQEWYVPDLVPVNPERVELLFVFESPHVDELHSGVPVTGSAGRDALRYLLTDPSGQSTLGRYVQGKHAAGDYRVAIMNVCRVPMQELAFKGMREPGLSADDWRLMEKVRKSKAKSVVTSADVEMEVVGHALLRSLRDRVDALPTSDISLVAAGLFAQRFCESWASTLGAAPLRVPHPSRYQWTRRANALNPNLIKAQDLFLLSVEQHFGQAETQTREVGT